MTTGSALHGATGESHGGFMLDKRVVVFQGHDRPEVEVLREGSWHSGELRAWFQADDRWDAMVEYNVGPGMTYLERVGPDRVRPA